MMKFRLRAVGVRALLGLLLCSVSCGDDEKSADRETGDAGPRGDEDDGKDGGETSEEGPGYVVASIISNSDNESNMYVSFVDSLDGQTVDHGKGREFSGSSDLWLYGDNIYISDYETLVVTKFKRDGEKLVKEGQLGLSFYGITGFGFWMNTFIDEHKAYIVASADEILIWNPTTMKILETLKLPKLTGDAKHLPVAAYGDRAAQIRDGLLYQPVYYADSSYFDFLDHSTLLVIDTKTDKVVKQIEVPCPGLDFSTRFGDDLYFSSWVFAPGGAAVLEGPKTCVAKVTADDPLTAEVAFDMADVTSGLEGGLFRNVGDGRAMMCVLDPSHATGDAEDVTAVSFGANWRFWSYDMETGKSALIKGIDWNAGAAYPAGTSDSLILAPAGDYTSTNVLDVSGDEPKVVLKTRGWTLRLFEL